MRFSLIRNEGELPKMSRLDFSRKLIQQVLGFSPNDLNCILTLPFNKGFDVSFCSNVYLEDFWIRYENVKPQFEEFIVEKLTDNTLKTVIVRMFNETVSAQDICVWLGRYCTVKGQAMKVRDVDGIWNCAWKVPIQQWEDPHGFQGLKHLPSMIVLGDNRGYIHYQGQPKLCRRCGEHGHLVEACEEIICGKCKERGHTYSECRNDRKCNLCGGEGHLFRNCPRSFANKLKRTSLIGEQNLNEIGNEEELIDAAGPENLILPPKPVSGGEEQGEAGNGEEHGGPVRPETLEEEEGGQVESGTQGGGNTSSDSAQDQSPPDTQLAKRTAAELSSGTIVSGKRGRLEVPSESSSGEDSRVFPSSSPNEVSFLNIVLQSTPKDRMVNAALQQRPSPRVRKGNRAPALPPEPCEVKEELCSREIN